MASAEETPPPETETAESPAVETAESPAAETAESPAVEAMDTSTADAAGKGSDTETAPEDEQPTSNNDQKKSPAKVESEEPLSQESRDEIDLLLSSPSNSGSPGGVKRKTGRQRRDSGKKFKVEEECPEEWLLPFELGWTRELVFRGSSVTGVSAKPKNCDVYYRPPMGSKCRSMVDVEKFLSLNHIKKPSLHNFTFNHRPIYKEPYEVVRSAKQGFGRNLTRTSTGDSSDYTPKGSPASPSRAAAKKVVAKRVRKPKLPVAASPVAASSPRRTIPKIIIKTVDPEKKKRKKHVFDVASTLVDPPVRTKHLCSLLCRGRDGLPPSMPCDVCMCMFHPECVGTFNAETFICYGCKKPDEKMVAALVSARSKVTKGITTGSMPALTSIIRAPRPPPLRAAPPRPQPPPSRIQPQAVSISSAGVMIRPTATVVPVLSAPTISPIPTVVAAQQLQAPSVLSAPPTVAAQPPLARPVLSTPPTVIPEPLSDSPPPNGQLLSLPASVAHKLDMTKSLSLKVNNQRFLVPPSCFFASPEGIKVFLPAATLPQTVVKTPSNPLDCTILRNKKDQSLTQTIKLKPFGTTECIVGKKLLDIPCNEDTTSSRFPTRDLQINPGLCFMSSLHVGYYALKKIFSYLPLTDLLSVRAVCQSWRRILDDHGMWRSVSLRNETVTDWEGAVDFFYQHDVHNLDLRGCRNKDRSEMWQQFSSALPNLRHLRKVNLGGCPLHVIHNTIEKCVALEAFAAEIETHAEQNASQETYLDVSKLSSMVYLQELSLQSSSSLLLPSDANLNALQSLTCLRKLTLTTLRKTPSAQFSFLGSLINLESLEIGDCTMLDSEAHSQLGKLEKLKSLRLEGGGANPDTGLTDALKKLTKLENLELIRFYVDLGLAQLLPSLTHLKTFFVSPDAPTMAEVNYNTLRGVYSMGFLQQLDWGIMPDRSDPSLQIPFLKSFEEITLPVTEVSAGDGTSVDINQLVDFLCDCLTETRIRVFRVPRMDVGI